MTMKLNYMLNTAAIEIVRRVNDKLKKIKPEMCFEINEVVLKVHSLE
jgi:hypothetical protein